MVLKQRESCSVKLKPICATGSKIIGPISKVALEHHAIILGEHEVSKHVYIAESMHYGYQYDTYGNFINRYSSNGEIKILANDGKYSNLEVAQRALNEINNGGNGIYNLITNNCESFTNRAMHGHSVSKQVLNLTIGLASLSVCLFLMAQNYKKQNV